MTTDTTHGHRPSSKSERNLIMLQININGIKNKLYELKLLITTHMQTSSQFRKPSSPLKPKHRRYITSQQCEPIGCTRQEVGSLGSLETTLHSLQQTYLRSINTHNTELQMVKVHISNTKHITIANMYIPPRDSTSRTYHTQSSPEM